MLLSTHVMQEVEATCSRLVIISQGRLAADGSVQDLLASRTSGARYVVEAEGDGVAEALGGLEGVSSTEVEPVNGRVRVRLKAKGDAELRPEIFRVASARGWTLWELHRERASLEQVFRSLTAEGADEEAPDVAGEEAPAGSGEQAPEPDDEEVVS